jgi:uncharacterized protein with HEPN domain
LKRDISIYLNDIIDNMELAEKFTKGIEFKKFKKDERTHYAVTRCIEVIGEATKHIPNDIRRKYPKIP